MSGNRAEDLLSSIDRLLYGERVQEIAQEAIRLRGTPELDGLLAELGSGPADQRVIGLRIAQITGRTDYVRRLLRDRVPSVQARALGTVGR